MAQIFDHDFFLGGWTTTPWIFPVHRKESTHDTKVTSLPLLKQDEHILFSTVRDHLATIFVPCIDLDGNIIHIEALTKFI